MLTLVQKSEVYKRVDHFISVANEEYGHSMEGPYVRFDKRGTCGGTANSQLMELNFNAGLMLENWDEYMNQVIPHEVAHLVKARVFGSNRKGRMMSSHGGYWKQVMRAFGLEPDRCHSMDTSKFKQFKSPVRKFIYECPCCQQEVILTAVRHNRMVRGTHNYSIHSGNRLVLKKSLGSMSYTEANDHKVPAAKKQPARKQAEPKAGTKIARALIAYEAAKSHKPTITRQEMISVLVDIMDCDRKAAAGYFQTCKKKVA